MIFRRFEGQVFLDQISTAHKQVPHCQHFINTNICQVYTHCILYCKHCQHHWWKVQGEGVVLSGWTPFLLPCWCSILQCTFQSPYLISAISNGKKVTLDIEFKFCRKKIHTHLYIIYKIIYTVYIYNYTSHCRILNQPHPIKKKTDDSWQHS